MLRSLTHPGREEIERGSAALARGAWGEAREHFAASLEAELTVEAHEGLGVAARYELDVVAALENHEAGFRLARSNGDDDSAARLAIQLGYDAYAFRGTAEATGWVERAAMLTEGRPPSLASAMVPMLLAHLAIHAEHDPDAARDQSAHALDLAREVGAIDVEMLALGLNGLARVSVGEIRDGMRHLDAAAAAAVGGEMTDADSIETVCCYVIDACRRVRDLERADEWCLRVREIANRFGDRQMFSVCRISYADVLMWRGEWEEADAELTAAVRELESIRPGREADALPRLAELRRRQGRPDDAEELLAGAESHPFHPVVAGHLALDRGNPEAALAAAERALRRVGENDRFERIAGLELLVRAAVAAGERSRADRAADELEEIAEMSGRSALEGTALLARGRVVAARGDAAGAIERFDRAVDLLERVGARYDAAQARLELAGLLDLAGQGSLAREAESTARKTLEELGVVAGGTRPGGLSPREQEVLALVARGLSNGDIATTLVLSVRTVERHVANAYAKIGVSGRTARAAATAWAYSHGIT